MKVLVVNAWDGASGVLTVIRSLAERLKMQGVTFSSFCFGGWNADTKWKQCCERLYRNQEISLTEVLLRDQFDLVHLVDTACSPDFSPWVWLDRAKWQGPVVCMSQNSIPEMKTEVFADVYIACSEASREVMAQVIKQPIRVIPNGADTQRFYPREVTSPVRPILGWVGRTADLKQKDLLGFLCLVADLKNRAYDFWIADAGVLPEELRVTDWFGDRINYRSKLSAEELAIFYSRVAASGGAIVSTSTFEGLPLALVEAAACGCPVIAPKAPGFEYLETGKIGLQYERYAGIEGILQCLKTLENSEERNRLSKAGLAAVAEKYNTSAMTSAYFQAYQDATALAQKRQSGKRHSSPFTARLWSEALWLRRNARSLRAGEWTPSQLRRCPFLE